MPRKGENVVINAQGYMGKDFSPKDSSMYRIVVLGDSFVAGPNHIVEHYSFPHRIEEKLQEKGYNVEVLNCGVDGAERSVQVLNSILYKVTDFDPDMILFPCSHFSLDSSTVVREVYRGIVLFYPYGNQESKQEGIANIDNFFKYRGFFHFLYKSYIARLAGRYYLRLNRPNFFSWYLGLYRENCWHSWGSEVVTYSLKESVRLFSEVNDELTSKNIKFHLFDYEKVNRNMKIAAQTELSLISLNIDFTEEDHIYKDTHFSAHGCNKIADSFCSYLLEHQMIPEKYFRD
ncbi:MAG: hypothetical protein LIP06_01980 [Tannerellaceae bacterium]|nr:hypothetical protein [Tannerellaceae bacterium]